MTRTLEQQQKTKDQRPKTEAVSAIILAAGRSERMGAFKPLLPFGSQTVIKSTIQLLRDGGAESIIVVLGIGPHAEALKEHLRDADLIFAVNPDSTSEMSTSIAYGTLALPEDTRAIVITPADHPAVPAMVVEQLITEWWTGARLVVPTWNRRGGHPVLVDLSFRKELLSLEPNLGLKQLFQMHRNEVRRIAVDSNYIARDMDTWDDYAVLHQEVFGVPPPAGRGGRET